MIVEVSLQCSTTTKGSNLSSIARRRSWLLQNTALHSRYDNEATKVEGGKMLPKMLGANERARGKTGRRS